MEKLIETLRAAHDALTTEHDRHLFKMTIADAVHEIVERQREHRKRVKRMSAVGPFDAMRGDYP